MRFDTLDHKQALVVLLGPLGLICFLAGMSAACASAEPGNESPDAAARLVPGEIDDAADCPSRYTTAARAVVELSWGGSLGIAPGTGKLTVWAKLTYAQGNDVAVDVAPCGLQLPALTTTTLLGSIRSAVDIPAASFDLPTMPKFTGKLIRNGSAFELDLNPSLLGLTLNVPAAKWPADADIVTVDHDGDGKPGVTAIPQETDGFGLPPVDVDQTQFADELYVVSRVQYRAAGVITGCADILDGTAEVPGYDYSIVGCHVRDVGDCSTKNLQLVRINRPKFIVAGIGSTYTTRLMSDDSTCADVRAALPAP